MALLLVNYKDEDDDEDEKCHGAFINRKWLIAAAHCFDEDPNGRKVESVVTEFRRESRIATYWFVHEYYGDEAEQYRDYDVGMVYFVNNFGPDNSARLPPRDSTSISVADETG